jgi:hypothetical protein
MTADIRLFAKQNEFGYYNNRTDMINGNLLTADRRSPG